MNLAEWGEWDALPGENPDDCLRSLNADKITQISNVVTDGDLPDGALTDGASPTATPDGALTEGTSPTATPLRQHPSRRANATAPTKVFVNGKALV